jgi:integron integrase
MEFHRKPQSPARPRLLDQVREAIRTRHYSPRTEKAYVGWIKRFVFFHGKRHPADMGEAEITQFLSSLATKDRVSASTQNQALSALLFLYRDVLRHNIDWVDGIVRAKTPKRLPVVLTREEVRAVLDELDGTPLIMATLLYGAGLRVLECLRLRIKDIDFRTNQIIVRGGKGAKDRITVLPDVVQTDLMTHIKNVWGQYREDCRRGAGWVVLPGALGTKYRSAGRSWAWQWVFPATRTYKDSETGQRRRHHLHESVLQKAVKEAVRRARVAKPASCHTLRHNADTWIMPTWAFSRSVRLSPQWLSYFSSLAY